jgi:hypothetical protein
VVLVLRVSTGFVLICAAGLALGGCSGSPVFDSDSYSHVFAKKFDVFETPEWARPTTSSDNMQLGPKGPVAPEDLVAADGRCAPPVEPAPAAGQQAVAQAQEPQAATAATPAAAPADRPVGSIAGDLASAPMPPGPPPKPAATTGSAPPPDRLEPEGRVGAMPTGPAVLGGVALGMTECQVVRRAGAPSNVAIGGDGRGERKVVLSYLAGTWPGIYHFQSGRLQEIDAAPEQPKPVAKTKAKVKVKAKTKEKTKKAKSKKKPPPKSVSSEPERYFVR